ncbi:DMT family transporter [Roseospirillum parvum]|uniref:Permease of the drug/metabolite transporter (DMT) superfamily n=1 Tax=Roseospirillum parvum TaxID=83401 RepID=A0A1G8FMD8_9PROT|nr:DMT family transporter [Roseospirillum parvum]SDH83324.1 Permease of the drug/metabolite transporter (DMT) superfamily [Roseospirillum parvum]
MPDTAPPKPPTGPWRGLASPYVTTALPPLFWAVNAIIGKLAVGEIPPLGLAFWRWLLALGILLLLATPRLIAEWPLVRRHWRQMLVLGTLSVCSYNTLLYFALETTSPINATLVGATMPLIILVLAWVLLGSAMTGRQMLGGLATMIGVAVVVSGGDPARLLSLQFNPGDGLMLLAVAAWSLYSVLLRRNPPPLSPVVFLIAQIMGGLLVLGPLHAADALILGNTLPITLKSLWIVAVAAIFPALLAFYFWNRGVAAIGPGLAGLYTNLVPVFTALMAVAVLGEVLHPFHAAAFALIAGGIWVASRRGG